MKIHHLAIHFRSEVEHELTASCGKDTSKHVRSLRLSSFIKSNVAEFPPRRIVDFQNYTLLRDLVIMRFKFAGGKLPRGITNLVHLRRLCLEECELDKLPSSIGNLVYLDTLDLTLSENVEVPNVFKEMLRLKHLIFPIYGNGKVGSYRVRLDEGVDKLETLAYLDSRFHELKCMNKMKNLRRFSARIHDNESLSAILNAIMNLNKIVVCCVDIHDSCDLTSAQMLEKALTCPNLHELRTVSKLGKALSECGSDLISSKLRLLDLFGSEIEMIQWGYWGSFLA